MFGGKDRPRFACSEEKEVKRRTKYLPRKIKEKNNENDNKNSMIVYDRLGWGREKLLVRHNLDGYKQYDFTNSSLTLRK